MENNNQSKAGQQGDPMLKGDVRYPVEQIPNRGKPTKKQVKDAVKKLNPDVSSFGSRG